MPDKLAQQKALIRNQIRAREAEIEAFILKLQKILDGATRELVENATDLESLNQLGNFETVLANAGLADELRQLRSVYAEELKSIQETFKAAGYAANNFYSGVDKVAVETLINADYSKISGVISRYGTDIKSQVARSVITGQTIDLDALQETVTPRVMRQISTEVNTGMAAFNRTVTVTKAVDLEGDNPRFIYLGPDDKVTREFCLGVLTRKSPPIYTLSEITGMSNGQLEPVISYGGGYNCRHEWRPISEDLEKELYGS